PTLAFGARRSAVRSTSRAKRRGAKSLGKVAAEGWRRRIWGGGRRGARGHRVEPHPRRSPRGARRRVNPSPTATPEGHAPRSPAGAVSTAPAPPRGLGGTRRRLGITGLPSSVVQSPETINLAQ